MSEPQTVNVGVIGAGWWATRAHIPGIRNHPHARFHSLYKRNLAEAQRVATDFGGAAAFDNLPAMLAQPDLHAVVISSTPNVHYAQAKAALQHNRHVLIEKPMTLTVAEAAELVDLAEKRGLHLAVSCPSNFTPHALQAERMICDGHLGRIKMISVLMTNPMHELLRGTTTTPVPGEVQYKDPAPGSYSDPSVSGGGHVFCQIPHAAAFILMLTGSRPAGVFARFDHDGTPLDLYDTLNIRMEKGELVTIASTGVTPTNECCFEVRVYGTKAILLMELWRGQAEFITLDNQRTPFPPMAPGDLYPEGGPVQNLIDVIRGQAKNICPGHIGLHAMEIVEAACTSAKTGRDIGIR